MPASCRIALILPELDSSPMLPQERQHMIDRDIKSPFTGIIYVGDPATVDRTSTHLDDRRGLLG